MTTERHSYAARMIDLRDNQRWTVFGDTPEQALKFGMDAAPRARLIWLKPIPYCGVGAGTPGPIPGSINECLYENWPQNRKDN